MFIVHSQKTELTFQVPNLKFLLQILVILPSLSPMTEANIVGSS